MVSGHPVTKGVWSPLARICVEVSFSKILNPKVLLMGQLTPCIAASTICVWVKPISSLCAASSGTLSVCYLFSWNIWFPNMLIYFGRTLANKAKMMNMVERYYCENGFHLHVLQDLVENTKDIHPCCKQHAADKESVFLIVAVFLTLCIQIVVGGFCTKKQTKALEQYHKCLQCTFHLNTF